MDLLKLPSCNASNGLAGLHGGSNIEGSTWVGGGNEGLGNKPWGTLRSALVQDLWQRMDRYGYIFFKAPSSSGKTSLLQLIAQSVRAQGVEAVYISMARRAPLSDLVFSNTNQTLQGWIQSGRKVVFCIDSAQLIYGEPEAEIWRYCKLLSLGPDAGADLGAIRFVVAASYGLGRSGIPFMSSPTRIPISPTPEMIVSVHPRSGSACLALSSGEFNELWDSFVKTQGLLFLFPHVIKEAVYEKCGRQAGLIVHTLQHILERLKGSTTAERNLDDQAWHFLHSSKYFFSLDTSVRSISNYRSLHKMGAVPLLANLTRCPDLSYEAMDPTSLTLLERLHRLGQIMLNEEEMTFSFTSPLHERYFLFMHYKQTPRISTTDADTSDLVILVTRTLERMSSKTLESSQGKGRNGRLYERVWQMEFYRSLSSFLPSDETCSPDVGQALGSDGYVEFFLSKSSWAIKVLWDSVQVQSHLDCFVTGGRYHPLITNGSFLDYIVVDLRGPSVTSWRTSVADPHLMTVTFSYDFKSASLVHGDNNQPEIIRIGGGHVD